MFNKLGPESNKFKLNKNLLNFIDNCTKYVSSLDNFSKFCIWIYTLGSYSVNYQLIFNETIDESPFWVSSFIFYYKNSNFDLNDLPKSFIQYNKFFSNYELYNNLVYKEKKIISKNFINDYSNFLQNIILNCPKVKGDGFTIFKISNIYPQLPKLNVREKVRQFPFNSTTINPNLNFITFIDTNDTCCLFSIKIPKNSICLYIPQEYHAFAYEREIILPFNCIFDIKNLKSGTLNYINPNDINIIQLQKENNIRLGNVFEIDEYNPCKGKCKVKTKKFKIYNAIYENP